MPNAIEDVQAELARARAKFPRFNSGHEGFAVLLEEMDELRREVFWGTPAERMKRMREEAVQVGAMALRLIEDICDRPAVTNTGETH